MKRFKKVMAGDVPALELPADITDEEIDEVVKFLSAQKKRWKKNHS